MKSIGAYYRDRDFEKDKSMREIAYLKEENQNLHSMVEQLQEEKEKISFKFIEEQEKVGYILNVK